jgi:hypothetical protein
MDRKEIEEKDQELLKDIREIVRRNEEKTSKDKSFFQSMRFWLPALAIVVVVAGMMVFNKPSTSSKPEEPVQAYAEVVDKEPVAGGEKAMDLKITYDSESTSAVKETVILPKAADSADTAPPNNETSALAEAETPSESLGEERSVTDAIEPTDTKPEPPARTSISLEPLHTDPAETKPVTAVKPDVSEEQKDPGPSIEIAKLVSCAGVQDRQYVSPQNVFSLQKVSKPVVWMTVLTDKPPFTLTHVYYHNDKKYAEVPLEVTYPRMRTWSRLTLSHAYQTGQYRVEVVTDAGDVLAEIAYTVVP